MVVVRSEGFQSVNRINIITSYLLTTMKGKENYGRGRKFKRSLIGLETPLSLTHLP
jgi:hypothetical protein